LGNDNTTLNVPLKNYGASFFKETKIARLVRPDSLALLRSSAFDEGERKDHVDRRLLAVDLGLRSATAVFDHQGMFLASQQFHFEDVTALEKAIPRLILDNNATHVVVEGEDVNLYEAWTKCVEVLRETSSFSNSAKLELARITAAEWRQELLLPREQKSSRLAKVAAGHIARQVVGDFSGKLSTDAAEAILAGHYASRVLGWADPQIPAVHRYSNGDVIRDRWSKTRQRLTD
jgi:hypothetical protein